MSKKHEDRPRPAPPPRLDDVMAPVDDPGLPKPPELHGGMPLKPDDDALTLAVEHDRVAAGVAPYAPDDVPPATDPLPEGTPPEVDLAQRGLLGDTKVEEG